MKKIISIAIVIIMLLTQAAFAAAPADLVYSGDAVLKASFAKYGNITVKSGAVLTIDKSSGFEVFGNITAEEGAKIVSNGTGKGQFQFTMRGKNAKISGIDIYFNFKTGNGTELRRVTNGYDAIAAMDCWDWDGGWTPSFKWEESVKGWCLTEATNVNLSDEPVYHSERDMNTAEELAGRLNELGLFAGTGTGYDLSREGSRAEALVMLIRLLGKEEEALSGAWTHPFTDVPAWADKYVGYAYETGLTSGTGTTTFGTGAASAQMYFTFILRALGKTDTEDYNVYAHAFELMGETGMLSADSDSYEVCVRSFWRADMAVISYRTLSAKTVSGETLGEKLAAEGVFTRQQLESALY